MSSCTVICNAQNSAYNFHRYFTRVHYSITVKYSAVARICCPVTVMMHHFHGAYRRKINECKSDYCTYTLTHSFPHMLNHAVTTNTLLYSTVQLNHSQAQVSNCGRRHLSPGLSPGRLDALDFSCSSQGAKCGGAPPPSPQFKPHTPSDMSQEYWG